MWILAQEVWTGNVMDCQRHSVMVTCGKQPMITDMSSKICATSAPEPKERWGRGNGRERQTDRQREREAETERETDREREREYFP